MAFAPPNGCRDRTPRPRGRGILFTAGRFAVPVFVSATGIGAGGRRCVKWGGGRCFRQRGYGAIRAARMTSSSHDALYRTICSHPDEDVPRLAFADLIEEHGDPLRAQFIRTQVALAHAPPYDAAWVKARQHEPDAATGW